MLSRTVHYILHEGQNKGQCRAALVTAWDRKTQQCGLAVFPQDMSDQITQLQASYRPVRGVKKGVITTQDVVYRDIKGEYNHTDYFIAEDTPGTWHVEVNCPANFAELKKELQASQ